MTTIGGHDVHPAAELFPLLEGADFEALCADVAEHGLRSPVMLTRVPDPSDPGEFEDLVLDGRNRYRACIANGMRPHFEYYNGSDLVAYVLSTNLQRRHLNESQRAMVASRVASLPHGGDRKTDQAANLRAVPTQREAAELLNVSERSVQTARKVTEEAVPELAAAVDAGRVAVSAAATLAGLPPQEQRDVVARGEAEILKRAKEIRNARTEKRRGERIDRIEHIAKANEPLSPEGLPKFPIVLADPPWRYHALVSDARVIENQYPTMSIEEICALPVADLTTPDALLLLWVPEPLLMKEGIAVIDAWGFEHRSGFVWDKEALGMGHWARVQHEHLLICAKGNFPTPPREHCLRSVQRFKRGEHSAKPSIFHDWLGAAYPTLPKIELFCRSPRDGWSVWGNQSADELTT